MQRSTLYTILAAVFLCAAAPAPAKNPGDTPEYPTKFANTGQPMQTLLTSGYKITAMSTGLDTFSFVLEQNGKMVLCSVRNPDKPAAGQMLSQCFALN